MFVDSFLDIGGQRLTQGLVGAAVALIATVAIAICIPVLLVAVLLGAVTAPPPSATARMPLGLSAPADTSAALPRSTAVTSEPSDLATPPAPTLGQAAIDMARRYLGVPYVFGGTNPSVGLDCSGLVQLVFRQLGLALPRTAQQQYDATSRLTRGQLQPGDLVFFARTYADPNDWITHVGIYIGNGQQINAPTEGQVVSIQPVFTGFWGDHLAGGGRVAAR
jgi:cell wall-associated NlpC family hydrolase